MTTNGPDAWEQVAGLATRGPLAWIIANLEGIEGHPDEPVGPAVRKAVGTSLAATRRLVDMFESLLAVRRLRGNPADVARLPVCTALEPVVRALDARARSEEKSFSWSCESLGLAVACDEDLLRRAVRLTGALAMDETPPGGSVRVTVSSGMASLRIRITGSATAEDPPQLATTEPAEIAFARMAVLPMGGRVDASRSPEHGTQIEMTLPVAPPPGAAAESPTAAVAPDQPAEDVPADEPPALKILLPQGTSPSARLTRRPPLPPQSDPTEPEVPLSMGGIKIVREALFDMKFEA